MADRWIVCTPRSDSTAKVFVNIGNANWVLPERGGSRICFSGDSECYIDVMEQPGELGIEERAVYATRP